MYNFLFPKNVHTIGNEVNTSCTSASVSTSVANSYWKITSKSASKSGSKAIGKATAKRYSLGFVVETRNETTTLSCSATGVLVLS